MSSRNLRSNTHKVSTTLLPKHELNRATTINVPSRIGEHSVGFNLIQKT